MVESEIAIATRAFAFGNNRTTRRTAIIERSPKGSTGILRRQTNGGPREQWARWFGARTPVKAGSRRRWRSCSGGRSASVGLGGRTYHRSWVLPIAATRNAGATLPAANSAQAARSKPYCFPGFTSWRKRRLRHRPFNSCETTQLREFPPLTRHGLLSQTAVVGHI